MYIYIYIYAVQFHNIFEKGQTVLKCILIH